MLLVVVSFKKCVLGGQAEGGIGWRGASRGGHRLELIEIKCESWLKFGVAKPLSRG